MFFAHKNATALASEKTKHYTLLLAFDFIAHQVPDILIQGLVLGLTAEVHLVLRHGSWVCQTHHSSLTNLCEGSAPINFSLCQRRCAVAMNGGVLAVGALAVVVASAVLFGDFARKVMDWVFVGYYSHNVFGNEQEYNNKNYKQLDPKLSNISWNLFKTIQVNFDVN